MRIGIIGAGAIGCVVGGMLTKAGRDVTLIDQWPEHVEAIKRQGLRLSGTCGDHVIRAKALHVHELQSVTQPFDAVFVSVKSYDTEWATASPCRTWRVRTASSSISRTGSTTSGWRRWRAASARWGA